MKVLLRILVLGLLTAAFGQAPAEKELVVAVSNFDGRGLAEGEAITLTESFATYLVNTRAFRLMERGKMDEILKEQGFQSSGACSDKACIVEMGQLLGVDNIITGSIGKVGGTYSVNVRLIQVSTGEIKKTINQFYKGEIDGLLTQVLPKIADELAGTAGAKPSAAPAVSTAAAAPAPSKEPEKPKDDEIKPEKKGGSKTVIILGVAVLVAGGAGAAYFIMNKKDESTTTAKDGEVRVTWD
ncbi:MAG: CsgG/HfaB family protein [Fibrobacterota bacterium]